MTSGIGSWGSPGKCYAFWQDYQLCLGRQTSRSLYDTERARNCFLYKEDYLECISRTKEMQRLGKFNEELKKHDVNQLLTEAYVTLLNNQDTRAFLAKLDTHPPSPPKQNTPPQEKKQ